MTHFVSLPGYLTDFTVAVEIEPGGMFQRQTWDTHCLWSGDKRQKTDSKKNNNISDKRNMKQLPFTK